MSLQKFRIYSPKDDADRSAELFQSIDAEQIASIDAEWKPILDKQAAMAKLAFDLSGKTDDQSWQEMLEKFGCPDAGWDWSKIADPTKMGSARRSYFVESQNQIQAAMTISLVKRCRHTDQVDEHMVYVEFLASAPWNRDKIIRPIEIQGLGKVMLRLAVSLSDNEGWDGRVGLHSLPQSKGFYAKQHMTDLGKDSASENLTYYEFTEQGVKTFLA